MENFHAHSEICRPFIISYCNKNATVKLLNIIENTYFNINIRKYLRHS